MPNKGAAGERPGAKRCTRREFVKGSGIAAVAVGSPGLTLLGCAAKGREPAIVGQGEHTYEWVAWWPKVPEGKRFGFTHGVVEDSQGRIYIHSTTEDSVMVFDPDGTFVKSWGAEYAEGAHGMDLRVEDGREYLYLTPTRLGKTVKTTLEGEVVWEIGAPDLPEVYSAEKPYIPTNVAFAPNGDFYVADGYGQSWVHHYDRDANYIRSWGGRGREAGKLNQPHGIDVDTRSGTPEVVVADRQNHRLQYFDLEGNHLRFVNDVTLQPCHFDRRGEEMLVPDLLGRLTILNARNEVVLHLGEWPGVEKVEGWPNLKSEQRQPRKFIAPHDAIWDRDGNIYVVEWIYGGRVTKLRRVG